MLFSVIIATYNRAKFLQATLESVRAQEFKDYETIVVDDGSTDETLSILQGYPWIRVLRQNNKGPGVARNYGVSQSSGEYIAFLDSDDIWFPWTLDVFAQLIREEQAPSIVSGRLLEFRHESEVVFVREESVRAAAFADYLAASNTAYFVGAGMAVVKREELAKCGGFTEDRVNAEDHDLILRLSTAPRFVQMLAPITLGWRRHSGGATMDSRRNFDGNWFLLKQERRGAYPGGRTRSRQRREIITRHARPVALDCLRSGLHREAWRLYTATLPWHISLRRWKFLFGFPLVAAWHASGGVGESLGYEKCLKRIP